MDFAEQFDAAYMAIQAAQTTNKLADMGFALGAVLTVTMLFFALYYYNQERTSRTGGCFFAAFLFTAAALTPELVLKPAESLEQARAEKAAVCEQVIAEVADDGNSKLASLALKNDCSRDKLLIAALSSGGLSPDLAKALISDHGDPGS